MRMFVQLFAILFIAACPVAGRAQKKDLLKTDGYGSLSGKVTLAGVGPVPVLPNVGKPIGNVWVIDKDTRAIANVVVWIKPPAKTYLVTHPNFKQRAEQIVIGIRDNDFFPRVSAFNPHYFDGKAKVATGQKLILKNSDTGGHGVMFQTHPNFNNDLHLSFSPMTDLDLTNKIQPQPLPIYLESYIAAWMGAKLYVFDHPYYAITKADGTYSIPFVPAGAEVFIMGHHAGVGYVVNLSKGKAVTIQKNKKTTFDIEVTK
ncbi:MAG: hypothetical protein EXS16_06605 [Gemmataceae bacterium]|nr:hypothetical protein [Gemmataceae bacterium]